MTRETSPKTHLTDEQYQQRIRFLSNTCSKNIERFLSLKCISKKEIEETQVNLKKWVENFNKMASEAWILAVITNNTCFTILLLDERERRLGELEIELKKLDTSMAAILERASMSKEKLLIRQTPYVDYALIHQARLEAALAAQKRAKESDDDRKRKLRNNFAGLQSEINNNFVSVMTKGNVILYSPFAQNVVKNLKRSLESFSAFLFLYHMFRNTLENYRDVLKGKHKTCLNAYFKLTGHISWYENQNKKYGKVIADYKNKFNQLCSNVREAFPEEQEDPAYELYFDRTADAKADIVKLKSMLNSVGKIISPEEFENKLMDQCDVCDQSLDLLSIAVDALAVAPVDAVNTSVDSDIDKSEKQIPFSPNQIAPAGITPSPVVPGSAQASPTSVQYNPYRFYLKSPEQNDAENHNIFFGSIAASNSFSPK